MRVKGVLVYIVMFLLIISISIAKTDYNESGNSDNFYQLGLAAFNENLNPIDVNAQTTTIIVSTGRKIPLISDLDGDGLTEVIILDGRNIEIYQNKSLSIVASFTLDTATDERFSNMITFDIDGDGLREIIIIAEQEEELHILEYNAGTLVNQTRFQGTNLSILSHTAGNFGGEFVIKCSSTERCLMLYSNDIDTGFAGFPKTTFFFGASFGSTESSISTAFETLLDTSVSNSVFCLSNIRHIAAADYDGDNGGASADPSEFEFIASNIEISQAIVTDELVNIYWIDILPNSSVVLDQPAIQNTRMGSILGASATGDRFSCDNSRSKNANVGGVGHPLFPQYYITSPLVFDAAPESGLETIIGIGIDPDEFKILMFEKDGTFLDDFPEVADSEGILLSNVFKADIFDDSTEDFCVMGFNGDPFGGVEDSLSVTCGSKNDPDGFGLTNFQTIEFRFDKEGLFNISQTYDNQAVLAHSIETNNENDLDEILSAYGVLELIRTCTITGNCDMNLIFQNPKSDNEPRVISTDAFDKVGLEDLIILTEDNLFYLDDGFTNQPATITNLFNNPCLDSVWKINTSVEVKVTASDPENDIVSVRAVLYQSDSNEQTIGFLNVSSGTEVPFSFIANKTIGGGNLLIEAFDPVNNPTTVDSILKVFSVAAAGVEFNDCTSSESFIVNVTVTVGVLNISEEAAANEALTNFIEETSNLFKVSPVVIILLLMLAWTVAVMTTGGGEGMSTMITLNKVVFMVIGNVFIFLVAIIAGAISFGILLTVIILSLVILGIWARRVFTRDSPM